LDWQNASSDKEHVQQMQGPEFKHQYQKKEKKTFG
jgi:hypothetical protein